MSLDHQVNKINVTGILIYKFQITGHINGVKL